MGNAVEQRAGAGLLPHNMFTRMLEHAHRRPQEFIDLAGDLFGAMATGGRIGFEAVAWFNGGLFDDDSALPLERDEIDTALTAAALDRSILGTLFERGLDSDKRSQLGAHYTDRDKIMRIVEPVIVRPLMAEWRRVKEKIVAAIAKEGPGRDSAGRDLVRPPVNLDILPIKSPDFPNLGEENRLPTLLVFSEARGSSCTFKRCEMRTVCLKSLFHVAAMAFLASAAAPSAVAQTFDVIYEQVKVMYATKRTNVRTGPSTNYEKIGLLKVGEEVHVIAKSGSWFRLERLEGQQRRFVSASLLSETRTSQSNRTINYSNGGRYYGQARERKRHGHGVYTWPNGNRYEGEWRDGKQHGRGVYTFADKDRYIQVWENGTYKRGLHDPLSTCLDVERVNRAFAYWVNRCSVGIDVLWYDEGSCRSQPANKFPCSWFVGANKDVSAAIEGQVWWFECESPGGLGDVIAMEKNEETYCLDSVNLRTRARYEKQRSRNHQATQQAIAHRRELREREREEEDRAEKERRRGLQDQRLRSQRHRDQMLDMINRTIEQNRQRGRSGDSSECRYSPDICR